MYKILTKKVLNPTVTLMEVDAPMIAKKAEPGQFIILRVDADGERIPLTIADFDREKGTITIIFQIVGATTEKLNHLEQGEFIHD
ncbi:MAG: sulfide/dihydroorotate dehydrogenase-like FAD/NAD-binding protein, partial [Solobacterium sp.]|nr:sulfide/dihydroorotate dehydrogenase-like FAD/NAD-binding protein [Solobacterium sp.]